MRRRVLAVAVPGFALLLAAGCGEPSAEDKIADATAQVERVEAEVAAAEQALERETGELARAQEELAEARETLREAEARLVEARENVAEVADDAYLFREVQGRLLEDPELAEHAIAARVRDGVVSLEGSVPGPKLKERATAVAAGVAGVERVDNRVSVELAP